MLFDPVVIVFAGESADQIVCVIDKNRTFSMLCLSANTVRNSRAIGIIYGGNSGKRQALFVCRRQRRTASTVRRYFRLLFDRLQRDPCPHHHLTVGRLFNPSFEQQYGFDWHQTPKINNCILKWYNSKIVSNVRINNHAVCPLSLTSPKPVQLVDSLRRLDPDIEHLNRWLSLS